MNEGWGAQLWPSPSSLQLAWILPTLSMWMSLVGSVWIACENAICDSVIQFR